MTSKLLEQAQRIRERTDRDLATMRSRSATRDGEVTAEMNGHRQLLSVRIRPETLDPERRAEIEELVKEAVNQATVDMRQQLYERIGKTATDLPRLYS